MAALHNARIAAARNLAALARLKRLHDDTRGIPGCRLSNHSVALQQAEENPSAIW